MVIVPAGSFAMGSPTSEAGRADDEGPQHPVTLHSFALGAFEITFAQWFACVDDGGCNDYRPADYRAGQENHPAINISWRDAQAYVRWLSRKTGRPYRLPSEAEWEYAARAGSTAPYPWGDHADHAFANYGADACCAGAASGRDVWIETAPVGSFPANAFGLHDMHGNAWEWVADCYHVNYAGAPNSDASWDAVPCNTRILRGGSWLFGPRAMRSAARKTHPDDVRTGSLGFRVALSL
ncbi:MAG: formylglycine-generating enzyme family protein [Pseudomonadota bacterium]